MVPDYGDIELRKEALETARLLLECGAVGYDPDEPFRAGQGFLSPLRIDARAALSCPRSRAQLLRLSLEALDRDAPGIQAVAVAADGAAVPLATLIAEARGLPLLFVRREEPSSPRKRRVEGKVEPRARVLLVEQLATDGQRKAALVQPLLAAGACVTDLFVIFQYGVFDRIHKHVAGLGMQMHALATWWDLLEVARDGGHLMHDAIAEIEAFLKDPERWRA
ncbi:MAG TPA: orotate phosphoribosyltransferase [Azospirillaceae bacterium]|nr:orotate phosphoribosyltransferase [Azospirillaceae bacterium]